MADKPEYADDAFILREYNAPPLRECDAPPYKGQRLDDLVAEHFGAERWSHMTIGASGRSGSRLKDWIIEMQ